MVTLTLLRHAKSRSDRNEIDDFDRPLSPRGIKTAPAVGRYMQDNGIRPDLVLCSPARRARQTLDLVLPYFSPRPEVRIEDDLYPASPDDMLDCLRQTGDGYSHVMIIAHNPGLHALGRDLAATGDPDMMSEMASKFPTAALAILSFDLPWHAVAHATGALRTFLAPKRLPDA